MTRAAAYSARIAAGYAKSGRTVSMGPTARSYDANRRQPTKRTSVYDKLRRGSRNGSVAWSTMPATCPSASFRGVERTRWSASVPLRRDDVLSLFEKYRKDLRLLNPSARCLRAAANRTADTVPETFVEERHGLFGTAATTTRHVDAGAAGPEALLILLIIGALDTTASPTSNARRYPHSPGEGGRSMTSPGHRRRRGDANHLVRTVDVSRLMGASVIITGLSTKIAADAGDDRRRPQQDAHDR